MNVRQWTLPLFWAAVIFSFVMAVLPHPPRLPAEPTDKIEHIVAFATLGLLAGLSYPRHTLIRLLLWLSAYGALIEAVQAIPALGRDSDIRDWIADTVAAAALLVLLGWRRRGRRAAGG